MGSNGNFTFMIPYIGISVKTALNDEAPEKFSGAGVLTKEFSHKFFIMVLNEE